MKSCARNFVFRVLGFRVESSACRIHAAGSGFRLGVSRFRIWGNRRLLQPGRPEASMHCLDLRNPHVSMLLIMSSLQKP